MELVIADLSKTYPGGVEALKNVSLPIHEESRNCSSRSGGRVVRWPA